MSKVRQRSPELASRPVVVGVTGGMAAGKSLVTRMFAALGAPTWDADSAAKRLYQTDTTLQQATLDRWGPRIAKLDEDGRMVDVNREALAEVVFSNPDELAWLEAQVHPAVGRAFSAWLEDQPHTPVVIREAAILFESGSDATCDVTLTVEAPEALRIRRAQERARQSVKPYLRSLKYERVLRGSGPKPNACPGPTMFFAMVRRMRSFRKCWPFGLN